MNQICPKDVFRLDSRINHCIYNQIQHIWISVGNSVYLKRRGLIFWTKFAQKGYFCSKRENLNITVEFRIFELVYKPNFILNRQLWFFGPNLPKKGISHQKQDKWHHYQIHHIWNFHLNETILLVWTKFDQKRYFQFKSENWHIRISIGTQFYLKQTIMISRKKGYLPKKGIFHLKQGKLNFTK